MPIRPTASTINDNQLDALLAALDEIDALHSPRTRGGEAPVSWVVYKCQACGEISPCPTAQIVSRQRSVIQENPCPTETRTA